MCEKNFTLGMPRRCRAAGLWLAIALLGSTPLPAQDCPCGDTSTRRFLREAETVFVGRVVDVEEEANADGSGLLPIFEVRAVWKGVSQDQIQVFGGETCAVAFMPGKNYLVFARRVQGELVADLCSGTRRLELSVPLLRDLGPPRRVLDPILVR